MFSSPQNIRFIRDLSFFKGLSETTILDLAKKTTYRVFAPKEEIYAPKDKNKNIYILKEGEIELYHQKNGQKRIFDILESGDIFGNLNEQREFLTHFAQCTRQSQVFIMPLQSFLEVVAGNPALMFRVFRKIARRMQEYERKIKISSGDAGEKILFELNRLRKKRTRMHFGKQFEVPLYVTHEVLAKLSGLNRVTVTRTIQRLVEQKKIQINPKTKSIEVLGK